MDTSGMFSVFPFPFAPICMVTVDSLSGFNTVVWEKPASDLIDYFLVYREGDEANVYEVIDTVSFDSLSVTIDPNSNPAIRPYRYKLGYIDTLARVFPPSDFHQTIHLTISQGVGNTWNLLWTPYAGFDYSSFRILRSSDGEPYQQIATVSASFSSYTDFNAPPGEVAYIVEVISPTGCNPANRDGEYASVYSNVASNSLVSVLEKNDLNFSIYPIPADKQFHVSFGENISGLVTLTINDLTGREFYSETIRDVLPGHIQTIRNPGFVEGIYLLQVTSGEYSTVKKIMIRN
jgi:hypothetical protein